MLHSVETSCVTMCHSTTLKSLTVVTQHIDAFITLPLEGVQRVVMSTSVCLSVCLLAYLKKLHGRASPKFICMLNLSVVQL